MPKNESIHIYENVTFTTTTTFSVNNEIYVYVRVTNPNVSNFLTYFCCVGFTGASFTPNVMKAHPSEPKGAGGYLTLKQVSSNGFDANGTLIWYTSGDTYINFFQFVNDQPQIETLQQIESGNLAFLTISDESVTLSVQFNQIATRLTYVLVAFSVIALEPPVENLILWSSVKRLELLST
ncbi:MAG TPA: hypothetical protein VFF30_14215 [Nitrososphaerales archaeon]|nr:hypothetical protein [Nitrososphaerales archaeon]